MRVASRGTNECLRVVSARALKLGAVDVARRNVRSSSMPTTGRKWIPADREGEPSTATQEGSQLSTSLEYRSPEQEADSPRSGGCCRALDELSDAEAGRFSFTPSSSTASLPLDSAKAHIRRCRPNSRHARKGSEARTTLPGCKPQLLNRVGGGWLSHQPPLHLASDLILVASLKRHHRAQHCSLPRAQAHEFCPKVAVVH